ncbi:MAG TPA: hypothetical protein VLA75_10850, partial [Thermoanaerobaculia bacterium]|nr:hypothetical protein [Thermoanaerobaculia bacterium]
MSWWKIRWPVPRPVAVILGLVPALLMLGLWFALTHGAAEERVLSPVILPSPGEVVASFPSLWWERALSRSLVTSVLRVLGGGAVAAAV